MQRTTQPSRLQNNTTARARQQTQQRAAQRPAQVQSKGQQDSLTKTYFGFLRPRTFKEYMAHGNMDLTFFLILLILVTAGLVMMFSASYVNALYIMKNPYYYIMRQGGFAVVGLIAMYAISKVRYDVFKDFSFLLLLISFALLAYALVNPYIIPGKEEFKRWIGIPGTPFNMQPSEIAKIALVMYCAWSMERCQKKIEYSAWMMVPYAAVTAGLCGLVYMENHLSGTILMFSIGMVMTFLGGIKFRWYVLAAGAVAAAAVFIALNPHLLEEYAGERITAWLDEDFEPRGARWQINQALYAIGSGGLFGAGLGQSKQKHLFIPEPQNDFIFAVVCEELGFIGALLIILLFVLLVWRGFVIALRAKDRYSSLLVMGICFQVGLQAALNIAVVTGTVPNTGISLPFFSYGGTSLMILLAEMGMVLSVSRYAKLPKL